MKRILTFTFALLFVSINYANSIVNNTIKLPKHFKIKNTFSGDLSDSKSFHLIFSKNKKNKQYTIHSYLFDGENIEEIKPIENEKECQVVSFYQQENFLTLLLSYKIKKKTFLKPVSINLTTKKITESEVLEHEDFATSFREKNRSVLIYKTDDKLIIKEFDDAKKPAESEHVFDGKEDELKKILKDEVITTIKTDEFVANGATTKVRAYLERKTVILTKQFAKENETDLILLPFENDKLVPTKISVFKNSKEDKKGFKKYTSYYNNGKLYQLSLDKKGGRIKISDIASKKELNTINLDNSIASKIKGNKEFKGIENFLKNAERNRYDTTITVNPTEDDKVRVRVDYVDKTYNYHYNWWWHHHNFMMWQNQMNIHHNFTPTSGFGPNQTDEIVFETAFLKKEKQFFEILIDTKGMISNEDLPKTIYKEIDKKKYIDKLEDINDIKHESSCFLKNDFRYIGYSRKLKTFVIQTNKIK